jgi:hypothetical protein
MIVTNSHFIKSTYSQQGCNVKRETIISARVISNELTVDVHVGLHLWLFSGLTPTPQRSTKKASLPIDRAEMKDRILRWKRRVED